MREDKQNILNLMLPALRETRALSDLSMLLYDEETEVVTAVFSTGGKRHINVAMDSGISMIRDVLKQIV